MVSSAEMLAAFRELSNSKQLDRAELYGLLQDGFMAALAKKYGPTVQAEVEIDDSKGEIVALDEEEGQSAVTLRPERGEAKRIPLAAVKEARLAFRFS